MDKLTRQLISVCLLLLCPCVLHEAFAQNSRGALRGSVIDTSGGRVAGAAVEARNTELSISRTTFSDSRGEFQIEELPVGTYKLTVNAAGFAEAHSELTVAISSVREVNVVLQQK